MKSIDWSKVLSYGYHVALLAGSVAIHAYAPEQAKVWGPLLQALAQASPTPEAITVLQQPAK